MARQKASKAGCATAFWNMSETAPGGGHVGGAQRQVQYVTG